MEPNAVYLKPFNTALAKLTDKEVDSNNTTRN